jgi:alkanesulfonate monooxygenase SsuD/methylene tetrahydromethanopterin reductase-like flavin-dependent oxidoreductase (luciferase family)
MPRVNIGVLLPTRGELIRSPSRPRFETILGMAETVESDGYHSVWVGDSVTAKPRFEALASLAAVAARTRRVKLGTAVLLTGLRNPTILAHQLATLDVISDGRALVGVGVGGGEAKNLVTEFPACGVDYKDRVDLFEAGLKIMRRLWREDNVGITTRYFRLENITIEPKPVQNGGPPLWIAAGHFGQATERQVRRVAEHGDGFMSTLITPHEYEGLYQRITRVAESEGRKKGEIHRSLYVSVNLNDDAARATREGNDFLTKYYGYQFWGDRWGPFGPAGGLIRFIESFCAVGVETFVVRFASPDQQGQLKAFTKEVLPSI